DLALARMHAGADLQAQAAHRVDRSRCAPDRARRSVEASEKAVARCIDLTAAKARKLAPQGRMVALEKSGPAAVSDRDCSLCRADEIGEEHGGEHSIGPRRLTGAGQELLDLGCDLVAVLSPRDVVVTVELEVARARNALREIARIFDVADVVPLPVEDQRRHPNRADDVAHVDLE